MPIRNATVMQPRALFSLIPGFLDRETCRRIRAAMDRGIAEPAEVLGSEVVIDDGVRRASDIEVDPSTLAVVELKLESARAAIGTYHGLPIAAREGASFLRYGPGGFYRRHCDQAVEAAWPDASKRQVSLVVFLNNSRSVPEPDEFSGGELVMFPDGSQGSSPGESIEIVPREGSLIVFRAATAHEVRPVSAGARDVIVDWFY
jgi:predicted 2-oxoglutarate/Fe(II)-dependent dioxygenase YbiX